MRPPKILLFILSVFALLFAVWFFMPAEGVHACGVKVKFPSYESYLQDPMRNINLDSLMEVTKRNQELLAESQDTLSYFYDYLTCSPNRIHFPDSNYTYFDSLFHEMEVADTTGNIVRIMHYGDSQLEMDRISAILRERLQERFGGSGTGMLPMIQKVPTVSIAQSASGDLARFAIVGEAHRAAHRRYGPMAQYSSVSGAAAFSFAATRNNYSQKRVKEISRVSVLLGQNSKGFLMTLKCDSYPLLKTTLDTASADVSLVSWNLPGNAEHGTISFVGNAEIYGVMLDGQGGVTVDNVALRGSAGNVFTKIDQPIFIESFRKMGTRLIILEFGTNAMPGISSRSGISQYMGTITEQFDYLHEVAPDVKLLFVGPSDMGKSRGGKITSWPLLSELNDSLKVNCLRHGVAYWDTFDVMGGTGSVSTWVNHSPAFVGPDFIHFTTKGANEIGGALADAILFYYDFYRLRRKISDEVVSEYFESRR